MYRFDNDPSGLLLIELAGFWTVAEADNYLRELASRLDHSRRTRGYALALVDGRQSDIQPADVMDRMRDIESILVATERDRAAYVVVNSIAKLQAQRLATTDQLKVFLSPSAARTWLLAYESDGTDPAKA